MNAIRFFSFIVICLFSNNLSFTQELQILDKSFELISVQKIWDYAPHNAFTSMVRFNGAFYCTFREGNSHAGGDKGSVRVIRSKDAKKWKSVLFLTIPDITDTTVMDARDPQLSVTPDGKLMLHVGVTHYYGKTSLEFNPVVCFSLKGKKWSKPQPVIAGTGWPWRPAWHDGKAWVVSYAGPRNETILYYSNDGINYNEYYVYDLPDTKPNEVTLRFTPSGRMIALLRPGSRDLKAVIGWADPPYKDWTFENTEYFIGGPDMYVIHEDLFLTCGRMYLDEGKARTVLSTANLKGHIKPGVIFPSGGDTSYSDIVFFKNQYYISYYSSHDGKTSIYCIVLKAKL